MDALLDTTKVSLSNFLENILNLLKSESEDLKIIVRIISRKKEYTFFHENKGGNLETESKCYEKLINLKNSGNSFSTNLKDEMDGCIATIYDLDQIICSTEGDLANEDKLFISIKMLSKITAKKEVEIIKHLQKNKAPLPNDSNWYNLLYQPI